MATSLKDQLRAAREQGQHSKSIDLEIPGYSSRLWLTLRGLDDYADVRAIVTANQAIADVAQRELYVAADTLVEASTGCFAIDEDGQRQDLGVTLGLALSGYLEFEGPENDRQAVFAVFPSTMSVMTVFADYDQWMKGAQRQTETELSGNSVAPG